MYRFFIFRAVDGGGGGGGGIVGLGWASSPPFFGLLSDGGGSGLALHTNQGVNRIAEAITANFGGS